MPPLPKSSAKTSDDPQAQTRLLDYLPRGDMVDDASWQRRHRFLLWVLVLQAPALAIFA